MENKEYKAAKIIENQKIQEDIYRITLEGDFEGVPGQFYMVKAWELDPLLPRPFSIHDLHGGKISFLYQVVGKGTEILSRIKVGETVELLGPLGNGFPIEGENIALVAGGIGLAPMKFLARRIKEEQKSFQLFVGFRTDPYLMDEMKKFATKIHIATDDGSVGYHGFVTQIIPDAFDTVYACGPNVMMQSLKQLGLCAKEYYSLEAHMACGIGACLGCSIRTTKGMQRVCHEGPVFLKEEVLFEC